MNTKGLQVDYVEVTYDDIKRTITKKKKKGKQLTRESSSQQPPPWVRHVGCKVSFMEGLDPDKEL
eukprot:13789114-Ditylum_brightwellii.AAC.1